MATGDNKLQLLLTPILHLASSEHPAVLDTVGWVIWPVKVGRPQYDL